MPKPEDKPPKSKEEDNDLFDNYDLYENEFMEDQLQNLSQPLEDFMPKQH